MNQKFCLTLKNAAGRQVATSSWQSDKHNLPNSTPQRGLENSDDLGEVANYANR